jgi:hypothetical protein
MGDGRGFGAARVVELGQNSRHVDAGGLARDAPNYCRSRLGLPSWAFPCRRWRLAGGGLGQAADGGVDRGRDDVAVAQDQPVGP